LWYNFTKIHKAHKLTPAITDSALDRRGRRRAGRGGRAKALAAETFMASVFTEALGALPSVAPYTATMMVAGNGIAAVTAM
jgi:hypothetical protein